MSHPRSDSVPNPVFDYQGAGLSLVQVDLQIGPFSFQAFPGVAFGHAVSSQQVNGVRQLQLRPASLQASPKDIPTSSFVMGYQQSGTEWDMIFRITTDPAGGLIGTAFAMDVQSNYPDTPMSIEKIVVNQKAFGAYTQALLPADYRAQITTSFWDNGRKDIALDAWLLLEVGYIPPALRGKKFATLDAIQMIPIGEVVLFPAHQETKGGVIGANYPAQVRSQGKK